MGRAQIYARYKDNRIHPREQVCIPRSKVRVPSGEMNGAAQTELGGVAARFGASARRMQASTRKAPIVNTVVNAVAPVMLRRGQSRPAASITGSGVWGMRL